MNIKKILLLSTMYACLLPVFGQQRAYSLDECIEAALKNNARIKNAENELKMAREDKKEAFTKYFPNISAAGTGFLASEPLVQMQMSPEAGMSMLKDGWAVVFRRYFLFLPADSLSTVISWQRLRSK